MVRWNLKFLGGIDSQSEGEMMLSNVEMGYGVDG